MWRLPLRSRSSSLLGAGSLQGFIDLAIEQYPRRLREDNETFGQSPPRTGTADLETEFGQWCRSQHLQPDQNWAFRRESLSQVYRGAVTKTQKLRNLAEGFMAALVECGYRGPWRWAHHQWEGAFYRVWNDWEPHSSDVFPRLELGGSANGRSSQARAILWELKRTSPFTNTTSSL